ncbi:MAG: PHP domain-containing protein [Bacillota bacterium]|nr:PHP domain-containing protein [Bacillota bacterium]
MNKIDLHMHTTVSDGTDTPEEIIGLVKEAGIDLFSITDHDSIKAGQMIPPMLTADSPAFIRGVEFSCRDDRGKYHILGYGYDPDVPGIAETVARGHALRMEKNKSRLRFLKEQFGFEFTEEDINAFLSLDNPGKPHLALMMVKYGYAEGIQQAISGYINKKTFRNVNIRPEEAIDGIRRSGGIPVLAHPAYGDGDQTILEEEMDQRLRYLMDFGLKGVEAYYSGFSAKIEAQMLAFADKYDLYVTAGSDYHGQNKLVALGDTNLEDVSKAPAGLTRFLQDVTIIV